MLRLVSSARFKDLSIAERLGPHRFRIRSVLPLGVRKQTVAPVEGLDDRTLRFTISTGCVDRDQDRIACAGWDLDHYAKNPVVLWSHKSDTLPIGKALEVTREPERLAAVVRFLPAEGYGEASAIADQVYNLAKDGWLSATSVGFRPLKWDFTEDKDRGGDDWFPGIDFHEQELVELSLVTVPSNPEALIEPGIPPGADREGGQVADFTDSVAMNITATERRRRALALAIAGAR